MHFSPMDFYEEREGNQIVVLTGTKKFFSDDSIDDEHKLLQLRFKSILAMQCINLGFQLPGW